MEAGLKRVLVVCKSLILSGGLLRFERVGRAIRPLGHELSFMVLDQAKAPAFKPSGRVLSLDAAKSERWDAVMIPGAGFPDDIVRSFAVLRDPTFGLRVQHILNDQAKRGSFKRVNDVLVPDLVVFNNRSWPVGSFTDFQARQFRVLEGGVDLARFRPRAVSRQRAGEGEWVIGGQASKNPWPLVDALRLLPEFVRLRLFGPDSLNLVQAYPDLVQSGRLQLTGPLDDVGLADFYHSVDCVVSTETFAGWANCVAEAMASGVPVVCTQHGTTALARHEYSALVLQSPAGGEIAEQVQRLLANPQLCRALVSGAREIVANFPWDAYAKSLLELIDDCASSHYYHAPEDRLFGKWPLAERFKGLGPLLKLAAGTSVIDFGCGEGLISRAFLQSGARHVVGFEINEARVLKAREVCGRFSGSVVFQVADLNRLQEFRREHADLLSKRYDIVLYLGIHHHLTAPLRLELLKVAAGLAGQWFAYRSPRGVAVEDGVSVLLGALGFARSDASCEDEPDHLGEFSLWRRI